MSFLLKTSSDFPELFDCLNDVNRQQKVDTIY